MTDRAKLDLVQSEANVNTLLEICRRRGRILILMQNNPDPDALASAMAMRDLIQARLRKRPLIGYGGVCGRAENRAMMSLLNISARFVTPESVRGYGTVCLVDAQPMAGNNAATSEDAAHVVIDHHDLPQKASYRPEFADVRPEYGATSTILYEYLLAAEHPISTDLATGLFYGIQSDTQELGREASAPDVVAFQELFVKADTKKLSRMRRAPLPREYFEMLHESLANCVVADKTVISMIRLSENPDIFAEVADLMLRLEGMRCSVCYGVCENTIFLSVRSVDGRTNAAERIVRVVRGLGTGGGHRTMAGAQINAGEQPEQRLDVVYKRILEQFAPNGPPRPLFVEPAPI
ncbi:MAG: DHH family phosphoesterase [Candidatus Hydrogenedentota bacterium]